MTVEDLTRAIEDKVNLARLLKGRLNDTEARLRAAQCVGEYTAAQRESSALAYSLIVTRLDLFELLEESDLVVTADDLEPEGVTTCRVT